MAMPLGKSRSLRLNLRDVVYVLFSFVAGVWQGWCFDTGRNAWLIIPIGVPFALGSCAYLSPWTGIATHCDWKGALVLSVGMPLCLIAAAVTMGAETGILYALGYDVTHLPLYTVRVLIGEGVACLIWAKCLRFWSRSGHLTRPTRSLHFFAILYLSVILAYGMSAMIHKLTEKNGNSIVISVFVTVTSAFMLTIRKREASAVMT